MKNKVELEGMKMANVKKFLLTIVFEVLPYKAFTTSSIEEMVWKMFYGFDEKCIVTLKNNCS